MDDSYAHSEFNGFSSFRDYFIIYDPDGHLECWFPNFLTNLEDLVKRIIHMKFELNQPNSRSSFVATSSCYGSEHCPP